MNLKIPHLLSVLLLVTAISPAASALPADSLCGRRLVHGAETEARVERIIMNNSFLEGENAAQRRISCGRSVHLRYRARLAPGSRLEEIYGPVSTGAGVALYAFGNRMELGDPVAAYVFQSGTLVRIANRLSLDWEWNVGLSFGWKPFDISSNRWQGLVGSRMNVYVDGSLYLSCLLSRRWSLTAGGTFTHFSNGNTGFPNRGIDMAGFRLGLGYGFGDGYRTVGRPGRHAGRDFPRHMSYDAVLYGSWTCGLAEIGEDAIVLSPRKYALAGLNLSAMYNACFRLRAGLSLDCEWKGSAGISSEDIPCEIGGSCDDYPFYDPPLWRQLCFGVSARVEMVLPVFTIGAGVGVTGWRGCRDFKKCYQVFTLKIAATHNTFVQIGYRYMEHLMLGVGYRFNNKYPRLR